MLLKFSIWIFGINLLNLCQLILANELNVQLEHAIEGTRYMDITCIVKGEKPSSINMFLKCPFTESQTCFTNCRAHCTGKRTESGTCADPKDPVSVVKWCKKVTADDGLYFIYRVDNYAVKKTGSWSCMYKGVPSRQLKISAYVNNGPDKPIDTKDNKADKPKVVKPVEELVMSRTSILITLFAITVISILLNICFFIRCCLVRRYIARLRKGILNQTCLDRLLCFGTTKNSKYPPNSTYDIGSLPGGGMDNGYKNGNENGYVTNTPLLKGAPYYDHPQFATLHSNVSSTHPIYNNNDFLTLNGQHPHFGAPVYSLSQNQLAQGNFCSIPVSPGPPRSHQQETDSLGSNSTNPIAHHNPNAQLLYWNNVDNVPRPGSVHQQGSQGGSGYVFIKTMPPPMPPMAFPPYATGTGRNQDALPPRNDSHPSLLLQGDNGSSVINNSAQDHFTPIQLPNDANSMNNRSQTDES